MPRLLTKEDVVGIFPPVVSPFTKDEELDLDALRREVEFNISLGVTGICVGGSTGEGHALDAEDLGHLVRTAQETSAGRVPVMAGIITTSTREAVKRAKVARDAGAQCVMVTPPIYQICSEDGVYDFYATIHKESGLPTMVYNVLTTAPVTVPLMQRMAANQSETGLIATKESIGGSLETLTALLETIGDKISVTWAHDWLLYPGLAIGATGSVSGAAALLPRHCLALWDAVQTGDIAKAQKLHFAITDVCSQISRFNWPAGVKACINMQGRDVGPCRAPFNRVPEDQLERISAALKRAEAMPLS
ncbi:dihydrodipicolinate synthase family protein [Salipiger marinus]|jgi:4-hydroxy-tetrahydrodipicolinate synthase|uniref:4-hydroxy-tetrahydrodipicolinate synthase n=1 Tax=Salipiger marinus TaxID=555512 RepID=A0A1G8K5W8_9RHOB|nr:MULTISPECIES: dihydrodipicolinate synthase family protein [Salipiger]MCD1618728.1 dihydrodipicolinate synthase family protein [Salipiger manganoxidans]MEB3417832.1 dihydrodipicolinate synthase family protein [Salipiger manganoxidans]SDI38824.1 4-hydroxy-tetrahydrodipicolinate synthase [Salipiger marinus]